MQIRVIFRLQMTDKKDYIHKNLFNEIKSDFMDFEDKIKKT